MRKRLLIIFLILVVIAVLVVLGSTVFTVQTAEISLYGEDGSEILDTSGVSAKDLIKDFEGKNILFLPESELIADIESREEYSSWQVVGVERNFPNSIRIHLTKRLQIFNLTKDGVSYAVDVNGYVVGLSSGNISDYIDISRFADSVETVAIARTLSFKNDTAKQNFEIIKIMTNTIWQLNYNYGEIHTLLDGYQIIDGDLTLYTSTGAQITILAANDNLRNKMVSAYGVYSNKSIDMTGDGVRIIVYKDGSVKTTNEN